MQRTRLYDIRVSRLPSVVGLCTDNIPGIAAMVNSAQRRLLYAKEAGEEGWWGTWAEIVFNVSRDQPYITLPREIARLESVTVCDRPVAVENQFYEYLRFGNGRMPKQFAPVRNNRFVTTAFSRNNAALFTDLSNPPQVLAIYASNPADTDGTHRILIQGLDQNGNVVYSQDVLNQVTGIYVTLQAPFVTTPFPFNFITGIQKDVTSGPVSIFQVDPNTGAQVLLLTMEPSETTSSYRRYYFDSLPCGCCPPPGVPQGTCVQAQVSAIAKLDLIPVVVDTDYLLIRNIEAIIEECQSVRYSEMDTASAKQMSQERHIAAVRMLNGELNHFLGQDSPAIDFRPFGSARLERQKIGSMM